MSGLKKKTETTSSIRMITQMLKFAVIIWLVDKIDIIVPYHGGGRRK
jgi:Na+-transporting NADH:ubiquinone oxidoreductase subunit NqrD